MNRLLTNASIAALSTVFFGLVACSEAPENQKPSAAAVEPTGDSDAPPVSAESTKDICALLTDEEIQQATGFAVQNKKTLPGAGKFFAPGCDWEFKSAPQGLHRLSINVQTQNGRERFDFVSPSMPVVPGVGDAAVKTGGNTNGTVWAVKGDTLFTLNYSLPVTTKDPDPVVLPVLKLIVSRQ